MLAVKTNHKPEFQDGRIHADRVEGRDVLRSVRQDERHAIPRPHPASITRRPCMSYSRAIASNRAACVCGLAHSSEGN